MTREYMNRPITKEIVAFGIGGQLHRDDGFPELPPRARVSFKAEADFETVKHKFLRKTESAVAGS